MWDECEMAKASPVMKFSESFISGLCHLGGPKDTTMLNGHSAWMQLPVLQDWDHISSTIVLFWFLQSSLLLKSLFLCANHNNVGNDVWWRFVPKVNVVFQFLVKVFDFGSCPHLLSSLCHLTLVLHCVM